MRRSDLIAAKVGLLVVLAVVTARWALASEAAGGDVPFPAALGGALLILLGAAGLYEGISWLLASGIVRLRKRVGGRGPDEPRDGDGAGGGETAGSEGVEGSSGSVAHRSRPFGLEGALWTFAAYVVGNAAVWVLLGIWVGLSSNAESGGFERLFLERAPPWVVWSALSGALSAIAVFQRMSPVSLRSLPGIVGLGRWRHVLFGVAVGAAANLAYLKLVPLLPVQPTRLPDSVLWDMLRGDGPGRWVVLATAVLVAPVAEELVFRGLVLEGLLRAIGRWGGVVGAGVLFTLLHVPDTAHYWPATVMILVMGLVAGAFRVRTGSIGPSVGVHFGHNAVVAVLWAL